MSVISLQSNQIASAVFWINLFEVALSVSVADCLAWWKPFLLYLLLTVTEIFTHIFSKRQKLISFQKYMVYSCSWISCHFLFVTHELKTKVMFILSAISSGLEFWSVSTLVY